VSAGCGTKNKSPADVFLPANLFGTTAQPGTVAGIACATILFVFDAMPELGPIGVALMTKRHHQIDAGGHEIPATSGALFHGPFLKTRSPLSTSLRKFGKGRLNVPC